MRVLLFGGGGQLGTEIRGRWSGDEIHAPARSEAPLEDPAALERALESVQPEIVVNAAAYNAVDEAEEHPQRAFAVNAFAVEALARLCAERAIPFVTVSTDYVFDGESDRPYAERDAPHPINAYGISKLAGELLVERLSGEALIVRTCGVYGRRPSRSKGYTFIDRVIAQARAGETPRIVADVIASPTYAGHLADAIRALIAAGARGVVHAANAGAVSWHAFASEALREAGIPCVPEAIPSSSYVTRARRPRFSALASERLAGLGVTMPDWRAGIAAYLAETARASTAT